LTFVAKQRQDQLIPNQLQNSQQDRMDNNARLNYLIATIESSNNENLDGVRETSLNLRSDIELLRGLTEQLKDLQSPYERKYHSILIGVFTMIYKTALATTLSSLVNLIMVSQTTKSRTSPSQS
jgi:hypothetical protein